MTKTKTLMERIANLMKSLLGMGTNLEYIYEDLKEKYSTYDVSQIRELLEKTQDDKYVFDYIEDILYSDETIETLNKFEELEINNKDLGKRTLLKIYAFMESKINYKNWGDVIYKELIKQMGFYPKKEGKEKIDEYFNKIKENIELLNKSYEKFQENINYFKENYSNMLGSIEEKIYEEIGGVFYSTKPTELILQKIDNFKNMLEDEKIKENLLKVEKQFKGKYTNLLLDYAYYYNDKDLTNGMCDVCIKYHNEKLDYIIDNIIDQIESITDYSSFEGTIEKKKGVINFFLQEKTIKKIKEIQRELNSKGKVKRAY